MFPCPLCPGQLCPHLGPQAPKAHEPPREDVPALASLPAQHLQPDPDTPQQPGSSPQGARRSPAPPADKDGEWTPGRGAPCPAPEVCECGCVYLCVGVSALYCVTVHCMCLCVHLYMSCRCVCELYEHVHCMVHACQCGMCASLRLYLCLVSCICVYL